MVVAWIALVLSVASLGWQGWTYWRAGEVVRVDVTVDKDFGEDLVTVTAVNVGRGPFTIVKWGFEYRAPSGTERRLERSTYVADSLEVRGFDRVEPKGRAVFTHEARDLRRQWLQHGGTNEEADSPRGWVETATGKRIYSKNSVPAAD